MGTRSAWTKERRARQAAIIRRTKPWSRSTGPRTAEGKAISSQNAMRFRDDPVKRQDYLALQSLVKHPPSPLSPQLWADVEAALGETNWDESERELMMPVVDDGFWDFITLD